MRKLTTACIILLCMTSLAWAEAGHQAKFSLRFNLSSEMQQTISRQAGGNAELMQAMLPEPITGELWWTDTRMRVDTLTPQIGPNIDPQRETMLLDLKKRLMYLLDTAAKRATKLDLTQAGGGEGIAGLLGATPADLAADWDKLLAEIKQQPGGVVTDLGRTSVNGQECKHFAFDIDPTEQPPSTDSGNSLASILGGLGGEIWLADGLDLPVKLTTSVMGLDVVWQLAGVETWQVQLGFFDVPKGYKVVEMDDELEQLRQQYHSTSAAQT
jgi:hypothetical protein